MIELLRRYPHLRRLFFAETISLLGDWLTYVAVSVLALEQGRGAVAVAMVLMAHTLPNALASPVSGFIADRFDRRTVLIAACLLRGLLTLGMAFSAHGSVLLAVQILLVLRTAADAFYEPAAQAVVARLLPADQLITANALFATAWSTIFTLGVALGGLLSGLVGPTTCILLDAFTFFGAAAFLVRLPRVLPEREPRTRLFRLRDLWTELAEAWRFARERAPLARAVLGKTPAGIASGGAWVLLTERAQDNPWLGSTSTTLGLLHALRAVGTGLGPMLWMRMVRKRWPRAPTEVTTLLLFSGALALTFSSAAPTVIVASLLWGMGGGANWTVTSAAIQAGAEDRVRGRLAALDQLGFLLGQGSGALLAAVVGNATQPSVGTLTCVGSAALVVLVTRARFRGGAAVPRALPS